MIELIGSKARGYRDCTRVATGAPQASRSEASQATHGNSNVLFSFTGVEIRIWQGLAVPAEIRESAWRSRCYWLGHSLPKARSHASNGTIELSCPAWIEPCQSFSLPSVPNRGSNDATESFARAHFIHLWSLFLPPLFSLAPPLQLLPKLNRISVVVSLTNSHWEEMPALRKDCFLTRPSTIPPLPPMPVQVILEPSLMSSSATSAVAPAGDSTEGRTSGNLYQVVRDAGWGNGMSPTRGSRSACVDRSTWIRPEASRSLKYRPIIVQIS